MKKNDFSEAETKCWMNRAIRLGLQGVGRTAENPSVGCVVLDEYGKLVGVGRTSDGGRPHAEVNALAQAGGRARDGSAFVTLEPCSHTGKSGPCTDALIKSGVKKVYVGLQDPNPQVAGSGLKKLTSAGIHVVTGVEESACRASMRGFLSRMERKRPFVALMVATTLDANTALSNGKSKWITGSLARQKVHQQRAQFDAIMVGANTFRLDKPSLDVRLNGLTEFSPQAVVLDPNSTLEASEILDLLPNAWHLQCDFHQAFSLLADKGINSVYVESGGRLGTALLQAGIVDELIWFRSPKLFGGDARRAVADLKLAEVADSLTFKPIERQQLGDDTMEIYRPCLQD
ncbi:MAG: bifunctional diaminohydroxyphosphoribosylaminopyrimidine deaminase/5-amino-6-(5-phosphoribosylamino)uracil reductase RibD [Alphaproteobacteria bacterium]